MKSTIFKFIFTFLLLTVGILNINVESAENAIQQYPNVLSATVKHRGGNQFDFEVTVSSPYDSPERYADGFRVMEINGNVLGERMLFHDHADEQPFTRDLRGVIIPQGVTMVVIQSRDQKYGYGGKQVEVLISVR